MNFIAKIVSMLILLAGFMWLGRTELGAVTPQSRSAPDRQALIDLENDWLKNEHDPAALERILASDFVHPVVTGDFLNKTQHIYYSDKFRPPANLKHRFDQLNVRLYGEVGIANGIVVTTDENGKEVDRSIFTDVFAYREGRWQAINAQENKIEKLPRPPSSQ